MYIRISCIHQYITFEVFQTKDFYRKHDCEEKNNLFIYMIAIVGQTAVPNWLTFFEGTHGYPGVTDAKINLLKVRV